MLLFVLLCSISLVIAAKDCKCFNEYPERCVRWQKHHCDPDQDVLRYDKDKCDRAKYCCGSIDTIACPGIKPDGITVVRFEGTSPVFIDDVPNIEDPIYGEPVEAWCFENDIIRVETNQKIGKGKDCIIITESDDECGTIQVISTTTFDQGDGHFIISRGISTIQPTTDGSTIGFTHITGATPQKIDNSVLFGSGKFENSEGTVRLAGSVNMENFNPNVPEGEIKFDCLFVLDLQNYNDY
eukprot:341683_1